MNTLSLVAGSFSSNQKQNVKEAAYIEYLKSFSQNGLKTLEKLESQFNNYYDRSNIKEDLKVFQKIRTLVSSYEVFVIEIHDSCEFIEVPEFGTCILKVFIQLIGILKWALQYLANQEKKVQPQNTNGAIPQRSTLHQNTISQYSRLSPSVSRREPSMRNTYTPNVESTGKEIRCTQCGVKIQQIEQTTQYMYKLKEQTSIQLKDINEEIARISREFADQEKATKKQDLEREELHRFMRKREEAQKSYLNIGLGEQSKNEQILSEILVALNRKGEAIKRFADLRMNSLTESNKIQQSSEEDYESFKHQLDVDITQKVSQAKHKLYTIFKEHLAQHQKNRQSQLIDVEVQIEESQATKLSKFYNEKQSKKFRAQITRLQKELDDQKNLNQSLQLMLKNKSIQYEADVTRYRNELISLQVKTKNDFKTLSKLKNQQNTTRNLKKMTSICDNSNSVEGKSLVSIDFNPLTLEEPQEDENEPKFVKSKGFLHTKKRGSKSKNFAKFQQISGKSQSLIIQTPVFQVSIIAPSKQPVQINSTPTTQKSLTQKQPPKNVFCQTTNDLLQKYLSILLEKQVSSKSKKFAKIYSAPKNTLSHTKINANILSYSKKSSSHMGNLANYYEIQTNATQNENRQTLCSRLMPKSSILVQKPYDSSIKDKQIKNDFIPIFEKNEEIDFTKYKKNYFQDVNTLKTLRNSNFINNSKSIQDSFGEKKLSKESSPNQSFRFPIQISDDFDLQNIVEKQVYYPKRLKKSKNMLEIKGQLRSTLQQNCFVLESKNPLRNGSQRSLKGNSSLNVLPDFSKVKKKKQRPSNGFNVQRISENTINENKV